MGSVNSGYLHPQLYIFCVDNMSCVGVITSKENFIVIHDLNNRPRTISYFTFHSFLNPHTAYLRAPYAILQFDFSLRLHHNTSSFSINFSVSSLSVVITKSSVATFDATLSGLCWTERQQLRYGILFWMDETPLEIVQV